MARRVGATRRVAVVLAAVVALGAASCRSGAGDATGDASGDAGPTVTTEVEVPGETTASLLCRARAEPGGVVAAADLVETSGVVASRAHDGVLWAHNDSGGGAEVFALGLDGSDLGRVQLRGAAAVDWEDIALLPGRSGTPDRVLVADIGDNPGGGSRSTHPVRVYRFDEPDVPGAGASAATGPVVAVDLAYADGPRDAEALVADPLTGDGFVVSKQWDDSAAGVYRIPAAVLTAPSASGSVTTMDRVGDVATTEGALVTGGDISADGTAVVLRTYAAVVIWDRDPARSVADTLAGPPRCSVPVFELQGEAVAVLPDGSGLVTVAEGSGVSVLVRRAS